MYTLCDYKHLFFPEPDTNEATFYLKKHKFPDAKWEELAVGLRLASATANIKANCQNVCGRLQALIVHWLANDPAATWQKLVDAVKMSNEEVIAAKLAEDIRASCQGTALSTIITFTVLYDKQNHSIKSS